VAKAINFLLSSAYRWALGPTLSPMNKLTLNAVSLDIKQQDHESKSSPLPSATVNKKLIWPKK
jgi:hypothetical protein